MKPELHRAHTLAHSQVDWDRAACQGSDADMWWQDGSTPNVALERKCAAICASCPIHHACLHYALRWEPHGFWGGKPARARRAMNRSVRLR
jgi:hypothetical protein